MSSLDCLYYLVPGVMSIAVILHCSENNDCTPRQVSTCSVVLNKAVLFVVESSDVSPEDTEGQLHVFMWLGNTYVVLWKVHGKWDEDTHLF